MGIGITTSQKMAPVNIRRKLFLKLNSFVQVSVEIWLAFSVQMKIIF